MTHGIDGFRIGDVDVAAIVDADCFEIDMARIFPSSQAASLAGHDWLEPNHVDRARNVVKLGMHSFLIRTGSLNILVDTCIGEHKERPAHPFWHRRSDTSFLGDLAKLGIGPSDVDLVFCTHLHADHVGWNTRLENGRWVPTFPNARYAISAMELRSWADAQAVSETPINHGAYQDSVLPIVDGGQAMLVAAGDELARGMTLRPLFGHSPGHLGLEVERGGARALFCGDAIHSAAQLVRPDWHSAFCHDPVLSVATRKSMLEQVASENILLCPAHFRGERAVRIRATDSGFRLA